MSVHKCMRAAILAILAASLMGGCKLDLEDAFKDAKIELINAVGTVQSGETDLPAGVVAHGDEVVLDADVVIIDDIDADIIEVDVPDQTFLGLDNQTGDDIFVRYAADGAEQGVFIANGRSLLLEYPCLAQVELLSEDHFDVRTGAWLVSYELSGAPFVNPTDFACGDAFIIEFQFDAIVAHPEVIDLAR